MFLLKCGLGLAEWQLLPCATNRQFCSGCATRQWRR